MLIESIERIRYQMIFLNIFVIDFQRFLSVWLHCPTGKSRPKKKNPLDLKEFSKISIFSIHFGASEPLPHGLLEELIDFITMTAQPKWTFYMHLFPNSQLNQNNDIRMQARREGIGYGEKYCPSTKSCLFTRLDWDESEWNCISFLRQLVGSK